MRIIFDLLTNNGMIEYPDEIQYFSNTEIVDDKIIADYSGNKSFTLYLEDEKNEKVKEIHAKYDEQINSSFQNKFSEFEKSTFNIQSFEWSAWKQNANAETPFVNQLAFSRGIDRLVLLAKIETKMLEIATILGQQQAEEDLI